MPARFVLCLALAGAAFPHLAAADVIFTDGTFNLGNYTSPFHDPVRPHIRRTSQCAACGDPGQALSAVFTLTTTGSATTDLDIGLLNTGFTYTPSSGGAIGSIDASVTDSTSAILGGISSYDVFLGRLGLCDTGGREPAFLSLSATRPRRTSVQIDTTTQER